jgi:serine/threonine-protein kinase
MGQKIGEGYFGLVFECTDVWQNDLAAKVFKPVGSYEAVRNAALSELDKLLLLRHPFITHVFDAFEFRDTFYIVTQRCYAPISALFILDQFDPHRWLRPVARCLLQAIYFLHMNSYAHQDIHAGNVFVALQRDELVPANPGAMNFKLGDLGVAKLFNELDARNTRKDGLQAPEVLDSAQFGPIDHRTDIYQAGLLFLQLAMGKETRFSSEQVLAGQPREMALTLRPPLNVAIEKALRRHVAARTADAMEFWRDLIALEPSASG